MIAYIKYDSTTVQNENDKKHLFVNSVFGVVVAICLCLFVLCFLFLFIRQCASWNILLEVKKKTSEFTILLLLLN